MASILRIRSGKYCPKCGQPYHYQLHRSWIVRNLFGFLPVKKQFCAKCKQSFYVFAEKKDRGE